MGRLVPPPPVLSENLGVYLTLHVHLSVPSSLPAQWFTELSVDYLFPVWGLLGERWGEAIRIAGSLEVWGVHERRNAATTVRGDSFVVTAWEPSRPALLCSKIRCHAHARYTTRMDVGVLAYKLAVSGWETHDAVLQSAKFSVLQREQDLARFEVSSLPSSTSPTRLPSSMA